MKTFVLWTHYDCEVYVTLHPTAEAAWETLKVGWLDDCSEDDCGHDTEDMSISDIASAVEYHFDELMYAVNEFEVPEEEFTPTLERLVNPVVVDAGQEIDLMARLESFSEQP